MKECHTSLRGTDKQKLPLPVSVGIREGRLRLNSSTELRKWSSLLLVHVQPGVRTESLARRSEGSLSSLGLRLFENAGSSSRASQSGSWGEPAFSNFLLGAQKTT